MTDEKRFYVVADMLTIGQKLDLYVARRTHVSDIREPLVRALYWKRWEWKNADLMASCRRSPEYGDLLDACEREVEYARNARRKILSHMWAIRMPAIVERQSSGSAEQVKEKAA